MNIPSASGGRAADSSTTARPRAHEWLCSPDARLYGGATAYLAHDAMATTAVQTTCAKGTAYATLDLTVNFVRPIPPDGRELRAQGRVVYRGRSSAVAAAEIQNADGKTVATATSSSMILEGRGFAGPHAISDEPDREAASPLGP